MRNKYNPNAAAISSQNKTSNSNLQNYYTIDVVDDRGSVDIHDQSRLTKTQPDESIMSQHSSFRIPLQHRNNTVLKSPIGSQYGATQIGMTDDKRVD